MTQVAHTDYSAIRCRKYVKYVVLHSAETVRAPSAIFKNCIYQQPNHHNAESRTSRTSCTGPLPSGRKRDDTPPAPKNVVG